jgi:hypothetical protein
MLQGCAVVVSKDAFSCVTAGRFRAEAAKLHTVRPKSELSTRAPCPWRSFNICEKMNAVSASAPKSCSEITVMLLHTSVLTQPCPGLRCSLK